MKLKRTLIHTGIIAAATAGPYAAFQAADVVMPTDRTSPVSIASLTGGRSSVTSDLSAGAEVDATLPANVAGPRVADLHEVFRFDVSPRWVMDRWPRVSAGLAQLQLQGYRVALVTGTAPTDLAGSLTYYFNAEQQVQRITFRGRTGNATQLVDLVSRRYGLRRRVTNDSGLVVYEIPGPRGEPLSWLQLEMASTLRQDRPRDVFDVALTLDRPRSLR